jgi:two-component system chemotaxis response regulator CheV
MIVATPQEQAESLICFRVADRRFALNVAFVREALVVDRLWRVPRTHPAIAGVVMMRGTPIAVVDTARMLGFETNERFTAALLVVNGDIPVCAMTMSHVVGIASASGTDSLALDDESYDVLGPAWLLERLEQLRP